MVKRMLIDATHAEETRVVVLDGNRLEEFDFETSTKKQIKGNIYLAKVTRVEPSLQAAFVEYGGNRHGFLAFSEIHPDYYRIPQADRDALMRETMEQQREYDAARERAAPNDTADDNRTGDAGDSDADAQPASSDAPVIRADGDDAQTALDGDVLPPGTETGDEPIEPPETLGGDDFEDAPQRRRSYRNYKIQEVITRRQILLVQVVKEERGNKGAALTTYLSLAGRYCVLMPNTPRGGGVSRKITSAADRKRLKSILDDLEMPEGMAVIVRTAGLDRPRAEIHRDYEYLLRLWNEIRETTLASSAPALIHEEGNLIKRAIRDLYSRDIDEVLVDGEEGYRTAKSFMRTIVPSHAKRVIPYRDPAIPLMNRFQIEAQLDAIHNPVVQLRSGGYIVINPTEALVAIDVNSGRATKERHIEETAYKTNMEAADEIARQVRLRDLAGLIVIDFIDMEETRNNHAVERRLKEAMKDDRARIQIGRISAFGLMELSRQRLRPSLIEASTERCPHCNGTGVIRSTESAALHVLRAIEDEGIRGRALEILVYMPTTIALYILNQKRAKLNDIEQRYSFSVQIGRDDALIQPDHRIERLRLRAPGELPAFMTAAPPPPVPMDEEEEFDETVEDEALTEGRTEDEGDGDADGDNRGKRRRRRRRRRRDGTSGTDMAAEDGNEDSAPEGESDGEGDADDEDEDGTEGDGAGETDGEAGGETGSETGEDRGDRRRRRGRRGGRRRRRDGEEIGSEFGPVEGPDLDEPHPDTGMAGDNLTMDGLPATSQPQIIEIRVANSEPDVAPAPVADLVPEEVAEPAPQDAPTATEEATPAPASEDTTIAEPAPAPVIEVPTIEAPSIEVSVTSEPVAEEVAPVKPKRAPRRKKAAADAPTAEVVADATPVDETTEDKPKRKRAPPKRKPKAQAEDAAQAPSVTETPAPAETAAEAPPVADPIAPEVPVAIVEAPAPIIVEAAPEAPAEAPTPEPETPKAIPGVSITVVETPPPVRRGGWWSKK